MFQMCSNKLISLEGNVEGVQVLFCSGLDSITMLLQVWSCDGRGVNFEEDPLKSSIYTLEQQ